MQSIIESDISDVVIEQFLSSLDNKSLKESAETFVELIQSKNIEKLISKIRQKCETIPSESSILLAYILAEIGSLFPNPDQLFSFYGPFSQAAMLISDLLENIQNKSEKIEFAKRIIEKADPITFAIEIARWIRTAEKNGNLNSLTSDEKSSLKVILAERIMEASADINFFTEYPKDALNILSIWSTWGSDEKMLSYLENIFEEEPTNVNLMISGAVPTAWEMGSRIGEKGDFGAEEYDFLSKIVDPTKILTVLEKLYGDGIFPTEYPYELPGENVELRLAQQFAWIYINREKGVK